MKKLGSFGAETDSIARPFREIWDAFFAAQVLVVRGQRLTSREFLDFARQFGRPEPHVIDQFHHPEHADILILSNRQKDGKPIGQLVGPHPARLQQEIDRILAQAGSVA